MTPSSPEDIPQSFMIQGLGDEDNFVQMFPGIADPSISNNSTFEDLLQQWNLFRRQQASKFIPYLGIPPPSSKIVEELITKRRLLESQSSYSPDQPQFTSIMLDEKLTEEALIDLIDPKKPPAKGEWDWDFKLNCRKKLVQCIWTVIIRVRMKRRLELIKAAIIKEKESLITS